MPFDTFDNMSLDDQSERLDLARAWRYLLHGVGNEVLLSSSCFAV